MGLLQAQVQKRLSAMIGAEVTFEKLNFSLLSGSVDAQGVVVTRGNSSAPVLTIGRIRAEVSLGAALRKEFVVKSLTIEKPVLNIVREADGRTNIPERFAPKSDSGLSDTATPVVRQPSDTSATAQADDAGGSWKLEAQKVLLIDGQVHYRDATGYHLAMKQVLGEVKQGGGGLEFTLIIESAGRRDRPADLGQIKITGTAGGVSDLSKLQQASLRAGFDIGDYLHGRIDAPSLQPIDVKAEMHGAVDVTRIAPLLPSDTPASTFLTRTGLSGRVELTARGSYDPQQGLRVADLTLKAIDVALGADQSLVGQSTP